MSEKSPSGISSCSTASRSWSRLKLTLTCASTPATMALRSATTPLCFITPHCARYADASNTGTSRATCACTPSSTCTSVRAYCTPSSSFKRSKAASVGTRKSTLVWLTAITVYAPAFRLSSENGSSPAESDRPVATHAPLRNTITSLLPENADFVVTFMPPHARRSTSNAPSAGMARPSPAPSASESSGVTASVSSFAASATSCESSTLRPWRT